MNLIRMLAAFPGAGLFRRPDLLVAFGVSLVVSMIVIPLPPIMLDSLIAANIAFAVMIMLVALFARNALEFSTFPTLLLLTTLFRLGLNVSTTRGILANANAGEVVGAFGAFVAQNDMVVGIVVFLVITLVQFIVIAKGAERVAEVGARFTLDAMPGKQMSIDAACRSGALTEEEAQAKRDELGRQSQMFGNMDGAMKFVKGDAIAGLIITALNLVAGMIIGVFRYEMTTVDAAQTYSILTIGDGLVAQVPALFITLAAGIVVTRVEAKDKNQNFGQVLQHEMVGDAKVLNIGGVLMLLLAFVPGLPFMPFFGCALAALSAGATRTLFPMLSRAAMARARSGKAGTTLAKALAFKEQLEQQIAEAKENKSLADNLAPTVVPVGLDIAPDLSKALGFSDTVATEEVRLVKMLLPQLRDALYLELGVRFPGVRVRPNVKSLPNGCFVVRINDVPMLQERIMPGLCLATTNPDNLKKLGIQAKPISHPVNGAKVSLIKDEERSVVEAAGITVWEPAGTIALYVASVLRKKVREFVGLEEISQLVDRLGTAYPTLVKEVVPKVVNLHQLVAVLKRLVDEGVSIRNLKGILEALGEYGQKEHDTLYLTEKVRGALGAQLAYSCAGMKAVLPVVLLDPSIEDTIADAITHTHEGAMFRMEPEICGQLMMAIAQALQPMVAEGKRPVVLTHQRVRRFVRKLVEVDLPAITVVSYDELPPDLTIQPMGTASIADEAAAA